IPFEPIEPKRRDVAERVLELHRARQVAYQADAHALESGVCGSGFRLDEIEAIPPPPVGQLEIRLERAATREQRGRRRAQRTVELAHDDLIEIPIIDPQPLAVAYDELLERLFVGP